jgi:hypothetical protein
LSLGGAARAVLGRGAVTIVRRAAPTRGTAAGPYRRARDILPLFATRRGFLRLAGATAAFSALARVPAVPAAAVSPGPGSGRFFDPDETEILTQVMARMVDTGLPDAPRVRDTDAVACVDGLCGALDPRLTRLIPLLLRAFEYGPILFELRFSRFTRLSEAAQDASLAAWMNSRIALRRSAFLALRNLCFLAWYSQDATWPLIGYAGPLIGATPPGAAGAKAP